MTDTHSSYEELAQDRRGSEDYREGYAEARRAFMIGQAVRERRLAMGLSQVELAARAGMTQPALSRLEAAEWSRPSRCLSGFRRPRRRAHRGTSPHAAEPAWTTRCGPSIRSCRVDVRIRR